MNPTLQKEKVFLLRYQNEISHHELAQFRGAINKHLEGHSSILFHNHTDDGFRYSYPLIQYKRINRRAALLCLNQGTEAIALMLGKGAFRCRLGEREITLELDDVKADQHLIQTWDCMFAYYLRKWLPLNQVNYIEYQKLEGVAEKCQFLERMLTGNILSMGKGLGIHFDKAIACKITDISGTNLMRYKNVKMMAFDVEFKCNVSLPDYIGLGKGASTGFGVGVKKRENKEKIK